MNSIIEELYLGNINPSEFIQMTNEDYKTLSREVSDLREQVSANLNEEGEKIFLDYLDKDCEKQDREERLRFMEGFRLGARLMLDVMACPNA